MEIRFSLSFPEFTRLGKVLGLIFSFKAALVISFITILELSLPSVNPDNTFDFSQVSTVDWFVLAIFFLYPALIFLMRFIRKPWYLVLPVLIIILNVSMFIDSKAEDLYHNLGIFLGVINFLIVESSIIGILLLCFYFLTLVKYIVTIPMRRSKYYVPLQKKKSDDKLRLKLPKLSKRKIAVETISIILLCLPIVTGYFLFKLHSLAQDSNELFAYRCTNVNPPLIAYKNAFLQYADFLNTYSNTKYTPEEVTGFMDEYNSGMRKYVPEETKWLSMQKSFMERWDYQLIEPWYIKEAGMYQWKMYEGYRDDAKFQISLTDNPDSAKKITPFSISEERKRRDTYSQKYFDFYKKAIQIPDWRKFFSAVNIPSACNEENLTIPETGGSIDWERDNREGTPSGVPIDPYGIS